MIVVLDYDFLTRHIAHKNPIAFLIAFLIAGTILTRAFLRLKIFIPWKILVINLLSAMFAMILVNVWLYPTPCQGVGCVYYYEVLELLKLIALNMFYFFIALKFYISFIVLNILYFLLIFYRKVDEIWEE